MAFNFSLYAQHSSFFLNFRSCTEYTIICNMQLGSFHQPYIPIDPAPGYHLESQFLVSSRTAIIFSLPGNNIWCQIETERCISVWPFPYISAVQPHFCISHGSVKINIYSFPFIIFIHVKMFPVPSDSFPG